MGIGIFGQLILIFFPFAGIHIYIGNFLLVTAACGMFSAWLLILEKRVPPKKSGTILLLSRTLSVGISTASPLISTLTPPLPHIIILSFSMMAIVAVRKLPPAGCFLPTNRHEQINEGSDEQELKQMKPSPNK